MRSTVRARLWLIAVGRILVACSVPETPTDASGSLDSDLGDAAETDARLRADAPGDGGADAAPDCDVDGDGFRATACGGNDCDDDDRYRFPGNGELCNGFLADGRLTADHDEDCDPCTVAGAGPDGDFDADVHPAVRCVNPWIDSTSPLGCDASLTVTDPTTMTVRGGDCDDERADVYRGLVESCDGRDNDCDLAVDEMMLQTFYLDDDGDGFGNPLGPTVMGCASPSTDYVGDNTDCDDAAGGRNPGAPDNTCDGVDNDCSGFADDRAVETCDGTDDDCDGTCDDGFSCCARQSEPCTTSCGTTGSRTCDSACTWATCVPPAEICNGVDDDCDTRADQGFACVASTTARDTPACGFSCTRTCGSDCLWPARCQPAAIDLTWNGAHPDVSHGCGDVCGTAWCLPNGPSCYPATAPSAGIALPPGDYSVEFDVEGNCTGTPPFMFCALFDLRVFNASSGTVVREQTFTIGARRTHSLTFSTPVTPGDPCTQLLQFRVEIHGGLGGVVHRIRVHRTGPTSIDWPSACPVPLADCGGTCRDLRSDAANCGSCGSLCGATESCSASVCCGAGTGNCDGDAADGCEADLRTDETNCGACGSVCAGGATCDAGSCVLPTSCRDVTRLVPLAASGPYDIDPDGSGAGAPLSVYCDMSTHGGGWILVGELPGSTPHASITSMLDSDLAPSELLSPTMGASYAHWNLARFDAYGRNWTVRVAVDAGGGRTQYAFYRPRVGVDLLPGIVGRNWIGTDTPTRLVHLVTTSTPIAPSTAWLSLSRYDPVASTAYVFWYRDTSGSGDCVDASGQTRLCHAPPGVVSDEVGFTGSSTAAFGAQDGVVHDWGHDLQIWLRDTNADGAP